VYFQSFQSEINHCSCWVGPWRGKALVQGFFSKCR